MPGHVAWCGGHGERASRSHGAHKLFTTFLARPGHKSLQARGESAVASRTSHGRGKILFARSALSKSDRSENGYGLGSANPRLTLCGCRGSETRTYVDR